MLGAGGVGKGHGLYALSVCLTLPAFPLFSNLEAPLNTFS